MRVFGITAVGLLPAATLWARWSHHDADSWDRMTHLGTEYYNDILSYRDPWLWDEIWAQTSLGLRTSAGSLNKKELFYTRNIRLRSSTQDAWQLAWHSDRQEEPARRKENSFVELSYGPEGQTWRLGLMGDGTTEKSFADIGVNASWSPSADASYRVAYWSVDPFYTEKKLEHRDYRTQNPATIELQTLQKWGEVSWGLRHSQDQPVAWHRTLRDEYYTYRQQETKLLVTYEQLYATIEQEQRREGLMTLNRDSGQAFVYESHTAELGFRQARGRESMMFAIWGMTAETRLQSQEPQHHTIQRDEGALLWNWSLPWGESAHQQDWAVIINHVNLHEWGRVARTEVKFNWGPDFSIGHGRIKLNSTWDLDQLASDFPFRKEAFHPWGGGQASFLIHF